MSAPNTLTATELAQKIDAGAVTAEAIVRAHLERIDQRDAEVLAWSHLAREAALERARVLDRGPRQGLLHGIPMGVKDIIDSLRPADDLRLADLQDPPAAGRCRDRGAGARRGRDPARQDGDDRIRQPPSRARPGTRTIPRTRRAARRRGSAAAVADFQVTLATGTQTGGSVIRPAAFCGVVGYKPSYGHFAAAGMKANTEWLDTIGAYARSVEDIALFRAALMAMPYVPIAQARQAAAHRRLLHPSQGRALARGPGGGRGRGGRSSPRRARRSPSSSCRRRCAT